MSHTGFDLRHRTANTNRAAPAGKCRACKRDLLETSATKTGSQDPAERWVRRCECGVPNFYPGAAPIVGARRHHSFHV